jgi:hypothetical protein
MQNADLRAGNASKRYDEPGWDHDCRKGMAGEIVVR